eukprot:m.338180 g.338180  ORF g.338180 m.338180 type:complete len:531 (+) comp18331_c0_seq1:109-1701(+)
MTDGAVTPHAKAQRYDRQLRLWGDHGQRALGEAKICCINAGPVGSDTLKNLVLPGIGSFTILDENDVTEADLGNNFFVDESQLGHPRAEVVADLLKEMNNDVLGHGIKENVHTMMATNPSFFKDFDVVIATQMDQSHLLELATYLWKAKIPLLVVRAYGMLGYMRLVIPEHTVVESHPEDPNSDLRLLKPFPSLKEFCDTFDLKSMPFTKHREVPFAVVLYCLIQEWRETHDGNAPRNFDEKRAFKEFVKAAVRKNEDGINEDEENFDEALKAVNTALNHPEIPDEVKEILESSAELDDKSSKFWIMVKALSAFVKEHGVLPVRGSIPDMMSDSDTFIKLQKIYLEKARQDILTLKETVTETLSSLSLPATHISDFELTTFCKNAAFLRKIGTRSLDEEYKSFNEEELGYMLEDPDSDIHWYVLLRAADKFKIAHGHFPGIYDDNIDADIPRLKDCVSSLFEDWGLQSATKDECIHEMCRFGASEIHTVASFLGGVGAQEVIKLITRQYVPFNNTYLVNMMTGEAVTMVC